MHSEREQLQKLVGISRYYGSDPDYVIAGGGNTSYKNRDNLWIKASGIPLAGITEGGFVCMSRPWLKKVGEKHYSNDPVKREDEVKKDLAAAVVSPENLRPSVETSLHDLIEFAFVVHTHPTIVNALMCSVDAAVSTEKLFGDKAIYIPYTDPGYTLFKKISEEVELYVKLHDKSPSIIFLQNHGVFVGADTVDEVKQIYGDMMDKLTTGLSIKLPSGRIKEVESELLFLIRNQLEKKGLSSKAFKGELIEHFTKSREAFSRIERPFTPDIIVYCKSNYLFLARNTGRDELTDRLENFRTGYGYYPKVILVEGGEMIINDESDKSVDIARDVFLDMMKISLLSENFGGPHFMTVDQVAFIDNWEVENYRRKIAK